MRNKALAEVIGTFWLVFGGCGSVVIAGEFAKAGLAPAGEKSTFFQTVPLVKVITGPAATLAATHAGRTLDFKLESEFVGISKTQETETFDAEAVFIVSNKAATWRVVHGMERLGIPAFGPIWDS